MKRNKLPRDFDQSLWEHTSIQKIVSHALPDKQYTAKNVQGRLKLIRWAEFAATHYTGQNAALIAHKLRVEGHHPLPHEDVATVLNALVSVFKDTLTPSIVNVPNAVCVHTAPARGRPRRMSEDAHIDFMAERIGDD